MDIEFISSNDFPFTGVGRLDVPFNTFRLGDKWAKLLEVADASDPHSPVYPSVFIDGEPADINLKIVGWAYGPFLKMAQCFGQDNHGWRNTNQQESPWTWLGKKLCQVYNEKYIGPKEPVTVIFFEPVSAEEIQTDEGEEIDADAES